MKTYVKPTVDVVELSVKENMANLPAGVTWSAGTSISYNDHIYVETVYDLTKASSSVFNA